MRCSWGSSCVLIYIYILFHCCSYLMYFQFCGLRFLREKKTSAVPHQSAITSPMARLPRVGAQVTHDTADAFVTSRQLEPSSNESLPVCEFFGGVCLRQCQMRFFSPCKVELKNHDSQFSCLNKCVNTKPSGASSSSVKTKTNKMGICPSKPQTHIFNIQYNQPIV